MIRTSIRSSINLTFPFQRYNTCIGFVQTRSSSSFDQLAKAFEDKTTSNDETTQKRNINAIKDIDQLLDTTFQTERNKSGSKNEDFMLQNSLKHPRDVAKSIKLQEPKAGRTVEVSHGNVSRALSSLNNLLRTNKVRYLQKTQARFIRPAKFQKQKRREWWRRKFSDGFKELMSEVRDAKRRGY